MNFDPSFKIFFRLSPFIIRKKYNDYYSGPRFELKDFLIKLGSVTIAGTVKVSDICILQIFLVKIKTLSYNKVLFYIYLID